MLAIDKKYRQRFISQGAMIACLCFLSFHPPAENPDGSWKLKKDIEGIKVYLRASKSSALKELKTVTRYKASLTSIVQLVSDKESYPKWVYGCSKSYYLKRIKDNESYHYQETDTPWPLSNRDLIVHNIVLQDSATRVVTIQSTGYPDYIPQKQGIVRVPHFHAYWKFTPLPKNEVEAEYVMSLDPGGEIPDWVVNLAVSEGPVKTLKNMQELLSHDRSHKNLSYIKD